MSSHGRGFVSGIVVCALMLGAVQSAGAQTPEFRAFWADVWHVGFKSAGAINDMVSRAVAGRYNAIFAQVLAYHDNGSNSHGAYWNSQIVPKAPDINTAGLPNGDPLLYLVQRAHTYGIQVHVWLIPFRASPSWEPAGNATLAAHPEWIMTTRAAMGAGPSTIDDDYTLDPGSPDVQEYLLSIMRELVSNYEIDGIHWDRIRYAQSDAGYPSDTSYAKSGLARFKAITGYTGTPGTSDAEWNDFRRREMTELIRRVRAEIPLIANPRQPVRHSASLITWGYAPTDFTGSSAYQRFQNWEEWMRLGFLDAAVPMTYYNDADASENAMYRSWVNAEIGWRYQRHMFVGPAIDENTFANSVVQLQYARSAGADGLSTYSYYYTKAGPSNDWTWYTYVASNCFTATATIPTMPWRSSATATEGTLWGRVTDSVTGEPLDDASVQVAGMSAVRTDGNGYYVVTLIPASGSGTSYSVTAGKGWYTNLVHGSVQVVPGEVRRDDFALVPAGMGPPTITLQPTPQSVSTGGTAVFTVGATGEGTLTYRWQKDGLDMTDGGHYSGVTTTTLTVSSVSTADVAKYRCAVTNPGGTTFSNEAALTLQGATGPEYIVESRSGGKNYNMYSEFGTISSSTAKSSAPGTTAGIGSRWGSLDRGTSGSKSSYYSFTPTTTGLYEVTSTWPSSTNAGTVEHIVTHAGGSTSVLLDQNATTNPGGANNWNLLGQFNLTAGTTYMVTQTNNNYPTVGKIYRADAVRWVLFLPPAPTITQHPNARDVCPGATAQFTVAATGEGTLTYRWRKNGVNLNNGGHYTGVTTTTLTVTGADGNDVANYSCAVTNAGGSTVSNEAALMLREPTTISAQPVGQIVCGGGTAVFSVTGAGDEPLSYQWQKGGSDLSDGGHYSGATTDTLTISDADGGDVASYRCIVTAGCGSVTSNAASLTLRAATVITQGPVAQSVCAGATAEFSVTASGDGTLVYQWQKGGVDLSEGAHYSGVTTATLTVLNVDGTDAGDYRCVVTGGCGSETSNAAALTVKADTTITEHPSSQSVPSGETAVFQVAATGDGTVAYQWQKGGGDLGDGGHYSGVTTAMLSVADADAGDAGSYRCVVTAGCGSVVSNEATLTVTTYVRADLDTDSDVDLIDFALFQGCFNGPNRPAQAGCTVNADLDDDGDVDLLDFSRLQGCFNGPNRPPASGCQ